MKGFGKSLMINVALPLFLSMTAAYTVASSAIIENSTRLDNIESTQHILKERSDKTLEHSVKLDSLTTILVGMEVDSKEGKELLQDTNSKIFVMSNEVKHATKAINSLTNVISSVENRVTVNEIHSAETTKVLSVMVTAVDRLALSSRELAVAVAKLEVQN